MTLALGTDWAFEQCQCGSLAGWLEIVVALEKPRAKVEGENPSLVSDIKVLKTDQGKYMDFVRMVVRRK